MNTVQRTSRLPLFSQEVVESGERHRNRGKWSFYEKVVLVAVSSDTDHWKFDRGSFVHECCKRRRRVIDLAYKSHALEGHFAETTMCFVALERFFFVFSPGGEQEEQNTKKHYHCTREPAGECFQKERLRFFFELSDPHSLLCRVEIGRAHV